MKYTVTLYYEAKYSFETNKYELGNGKKFAFVDYDSVQNLLGYMTEGNNDVMIRIQREDESNE